MEAGTRLFLEGLGERFPGDDLDATPERVARAWAEDLAGGYELDAATELTWTPVPEGAALVLVRDVKFASLCVHHLLPFVGEAQLAYLPGRRLAGLSKLGRVVDLYARRLQLQERLTAQILTALVEQLEPRGAAVLMEAEHTCMTLRGVRKEGSRLVTLATAGVFETDPEARREVLDLMGSSRGRDTRERI
jgi:GTP cyclohydrolase I